MDVTGLAIGVTVALAVGILVLLVVLAAYLRSRRRVEKLRELTTSGNIRRRTVTSTAQLPPTDNVAEALRRSAAANGLTKRMTGYPGRMYIPAESIEMQERWYADDDANFHERGVYPDNYERHIVPARRHDELDDSLSWSWSDSSSESSSDDDTRHRRTRRLPVVRPPLLMPTPAAATTAALVHPTPAVVQPQPPPPAFLLPTPPPQPSVYVPAAPAAPAPTSATPSQPAAYESSGGGGYVLPDRRSAVFTAMRAGTTPAAHGRVEEYEEQKREAIATEGGNSSRFVPFRRAVVDARPSSAAVAGRRDYEEQTASVTVTSTRRPVPAPRQSTRSMTSTTAVARVRATTADRRRSQ